MSGKELSGSGNEPKASDMELLQILREAKEEDGIPALMTSQFNDVGDFDYSTTGLNDRLKQLHQEKLLGHQKAANRHLWWLPSEGTTEEAELSTLEEMIDYGSLEPSRFSSEKANEIAEVCLPDYGDNNWWQRIHSLGGTIFRGGVFLFTISFALLVVDNIPLPPSYLGLVLVVGLCFIGASAFVIGTGSVGQKLVERDKLPGEPFGGEDLVKFLLHLRRGK